MALLLGHLGEFCPDTEEWTHYELRLKHYFAANEIEDASKQKSVFLTCIGSVAFKQLTSLIAPASVDEKTLKVLKETLQKYYGPVPSEVVQHYHFNSRNWKPGESVASYVAELRAIARHCHYGDSLLLMLRDRLVCGIKQQADSV